VSEGVSSGELEGGLIAQTTKGVEAAAWKQLYSVISEEGLYATYDSHSQVHLLS
jgi:hypothetical protein